MTMVLCGCAGITAVNIPGVGNLDFDPAPLSHEDKVLQYMALVEVARQETVGTSVSWKNEFSGHRGNYTVTRLNPRLGGSGGLGYGQNLDAGCDPRYAGGPVHSIEVTEEINSEGREYITSGLGFYRVRGGRWYRYK